MKLSPKLEDYRVRHGYMASERGADYGKFEDVPGPCGQALRIISSGSDSETGWEHVSVSGRRVPNWQEMCWVKDLFWSDEDCVVQFHPARSEYVNFHPRCLHLWRPLRADMPTPPAHLVGPRT